MAGGTTETQEVYQQEIARKEEFGWFFAHCRRYLQIATTEGKRMTAMAGIDHFAIANMADIENMSNFFTEEVRGRILRSGGVHGRVTFTS